MIKTKYILFIYTLFSNDEDVEKFCSGFFKYEKLESLKFIVENKQNVIIIFDSDLDTQEISTFLNQEVMTLIKPLYLKFYFLFNFISLTSAQVSKELKDYIFDTSPSNETNLIKLDYNINTAKPEFDYTRLMEKVKEFGVNKLTEEERKFLDEYLLD